MKKAQVLCFAMFIGCFASSLFAQSVGSWEWGYQLGQDLFMEALRDANRIPYKIQNETGKNIQEVYISRSDSESWGKNLWSSQELFQSGYYIDVKSDDVGPYDIMLVDTDGWSYVRSHVRITTDTEIVITKSNRDKKWF